jgi:putative glutamine amidotransferase
VATPLIGITTYGPDEELNLPSFTLPTVYCEAVEQAGGVPVLLPATSSVASEILGRLDGLILSGGGDIDPARHAGGSHPAVYMLTPQRDAYELELTRRALERPELPVLGICRGMQIMNVARGGDLELHLPDARGEQVAHRLPPREPTHHPVELEPGSALDEIYGQLSFSVCSWHHQEVRTLGSGLRPIARAPDGVIEGLVFDEHPFALGVQWHPEMQVAADPLQRRLFRALVERAQKP